MFKENYIIKGKIVCKTGLHIGGSSDAIDIGGSDNVNNDKIVNAIRKLNFRFETKNQTVC